MVSTARLNQIAERIGVPTNRFVVAAHEPQANEIRWCDFGRDGTISDLDTIKKRPVLILGLACDSPAYRLVPMVHVAPFTTQIKQSDMRYDTIFNRRHVQIDASGITTVPIRKLSEMAIGHLDNFEVRQFQAVMRKVISLGDYGNQKALLSRSRIYRMMGYEDLFKGSANLAVIAGRNTYSQASTTHAVPLTSHAAEGNIQVAVGGFTYRVDPAQLRRIDYGMLESDSLGSLLHLSMTKLDNILSRNLGF